MLRNTANLFVLEVWHEGFLIYFSGLLYKNAPRWASNSPIKPDTEYQDLSRLSNITYR